MPSNPALLASLERAHRAHKLGAQLCQRWKAPTFRRWQSEDDVERPPLTGMLRRGGGWRNEDGMVTAETAVVLPAIALVLILVVSGAAAGVTHMRVTDCARVVARAAAIGQMDLQSVAYRTAPGVAIMIDDGELTCVSASKVLPGPLGRMGMQARARACSYTEPSETP